jgi:hypothetical protein
MEETMVKITNVKPKQMKQIPWGWKNVVGDDGSLWVSEPLGEIKMPKIINYFNFSQWEEENIFELEAEPGTICSVNMKSVFTTACRFLGTEEALMQLALREIDLSPISKSMLEWNALCFGSYPKHIDRMILGDEIGMNTGMIMSPDLYCEALLPIHKEFISLAN